MNYSSGDFESASLTTSGGDMWSLSADTFLTLTLIILGVNSVGVAGNGLLVIGLLKGSSRFSPASLQMLLQQGLVDFFNCLTAILLSFDNLSWPPVGSVPDVFIVFICFVWHSQVVSWNLYCLSVYNNVLIAAERMVAIVFPFHAAQIARKRYRFILFFGWIAYVFIYNGPQFLYVTYDFANGCQSANIFATPVLRLWAYAWYFLTYPIPIALAIIFNASSVVSLHRQRQKIGMINVDISGQKDGRNTGSDAIQLTRRAEIGLQRASIALIVLLAITSFPMQVITSIEAVIGYWWGMTNFWNVIDVGIGALYFAFTPIICVIFLSGIRRALFFFCTAPIKHRHPLKSHKSVTVSTGAHS